MSVGPTKWQMTSAVLRGLFIVALLALLAHGGVRYVAPARIASPVSGSLRPIVEADWIKVPFDVDRTKECLSNSTIKLTREHDYGGGLGRREDTVVIGLYNTTITDLGQHRVMLWFRRPPGLVGFWDFDAKAQDDCGGLLDLTNGQPRHGTYDKLFLGPEG